MKRSMSEASPWSARKRRSSDSGAYLASIARLQEGLGELDRHCAEEQVIIQKKYDKQKEPLIKARSAAIANIPGFWRTALINHPDVFISEQDLPILQYLDDIHLEDNQDDYGSHIITFRWIEGNPYFSEREIFKKVLISDSESITNSSISWAPGKAPKGDSFFDFFTVDVSAPGDLADLLRRDLWINPYPYYLGVIDNFKEDQGFVRLSSHGLFESDDEEQAVPV